MYDGKAFDATKQGALTGIAMMKKFTWGQLAIAMSEATPGNAQMKKYIDFLVPWWGISLPYYLDAAVYFQVRPSRVQS